MISGKSSRAPTNAHHLAALSRDLRRRDPCIRDRDTATAQSSYPNRPIKLVVSYPPVR
jgi:hypothetical protein